MDYRIDILKQLRKRINRIEKMNNNYMNSPTWKHYKAIEDNLYNQINFEKN